MKSFQGTKGAIILVAISIVAISALLNCGGGSNNAATPGVTSLSVAADGACTPRLEKDMLRYLESCRDFRGHQSDEKLRKLAEECRRFTQVHGEAVVCNLTRLPDDFDGPYVRGCMGLADEETAPNGILKFKLRGIHKVCGDFSSTGSDLGSQGPPPGFTNYSRHRRDHDDD